MRSTLSDSMDKYKTSHVSLCRYVCIFELYGIVCVQISSWHSKQNECVMRVMLYVWTSCQFISHYQSDVSLQVVDTKYCRDPLMPPTQQSVFSY